MLSVIVVVLSMTWGQVFASAEPAAQAEARVASPELSTASRLQDRREVAAGTRAYSIGFEDGQLIDVPANLRNLDLGVGTALNFGRAELQISPKIRGSAA